MNLLGSGSYGCVTNKSIKKKALKLNYISDTDKKSFDLDEKNGKHIAKFFIDTKSYCEELLIINLILNKYYQVFGTVNVFNELSVLPKRCATYTIKDNNDTIKKEHINKLFNNNQVTSCLYDIITYDSDYIHEIVYNDGGQQLGKVVLTDYELVKSLIVFCKSLETFHELNFVHRDIKDDNILYKDGKLSLIDYGLSVEARNVYSDIEEWFVGGAYFLHPPEYAIYNKTNMFRNLDLFHLEYKNEHFYNVKKKEYEKFLSKYENVTNINNMPKELKDIAYQGDVYSLGTVLLFIYLKFNNIKITYHDKDLIDNKFKTLITNMIITDPFERYTIKQVINDLLEISSYFHTNTNNVNLNKTECLNNITSITENLSKLKTQKGGKYKVKKKAKKFPKIKLL